MQKRSVRWSEGAYVAEGLELLSSALDAQIPIEAVYVALDEAGRADVASLTGAAADAGVPVYELGPGVLARVADAVTPQPVLTVLPLSVSDLDRLESATGVIVCADVRDPGNAGTVIRCADAAGMDAVVFTGDSVDPFNAKALRASAGSLFYRPVVVQRDLQQTLHTLSGFGIRVLGTVAQGGEDYASVNWSIPSAIVLGNEAAGLSSELIGKLDGAVTIPMAGRAESLNVAMACAVICFEVRRQRRSGGRRSPYDAGDATAGDAEARTP